MQFRNISTFMFMTSVVGPLTVPVLIQSKLSIYVSFYTVAVKGRFSLIIKSESELQSEVKSHYWYVIM